MIKTTTLSGAEQKVEFAGNHTHYWIQNLSDSDVLASMSSGITEGADNVLTIPAGGVSYVRDDKGASSVYLLGTGKVQIYGKSNEFCPFKLASGGGDSGGSGETNKIESISVNGQTVAPDANKNVNIEIPEMPEDIDADTVNGHTVESNVPANAVFTDTVYMLPAASESALGGVLSGGDISVDENGSVTVNTVNGKTVGADVPEDAVFTDTVINVDNELSNVSENPVQNKVIKAALDAIGGSGENTGVKILHGQATIDGTVTITFDEEFTEIPTVIATPLTTTTGKVVGVSFTDVSTTGFTAESRHISINQNANKVSGTLHWTAFGK